ncbi:MAG: SUMF1/EgtB/PvdO family nonheme iron enzyme [Myxococcales bacterium]|nr:SUMF1/EgtB/PvdO family nonheme iron enzyme [Myxococcales bacterium]
MKALVIGNGNYDDDDADLANAVNDARRVGAALREAGMQVRVETNLGLRQMDDVIAAFVRGLGPDEQAVFYYAGHAFELPEGSGRANFLIPTDFSARTAGRARSQAYPLDALTTDLVQRGSGLNLVILDACRNDPFTRGWSRSGESRGLTVVSTASLADTTAIWFSTSPGEVAADSGEDPLLDENSPFAVALVEALSDEAQDPDFGAVYRRVVRRVEELTENQQRPMKWENLRDPLYLSVRASAAAPSCPEGQAWVEDASRCVCWDTARCGERMEASPEEIPGMVYIPAGTFMMGNPSGGEDERPVHEVTLSAYYMDRTEVTVRAYGQCVTEGACSIPDSGGGGMYNWGVPARDEHPVNGVHWLDGQAYCIWRAGQVGRLPTEAEWEYAARGRDGRAYPWGNDAPSARLLQWSGGCGQPFCAGGTAPVGTHAAGRSVFGLEDMAGNVSEWVSDWHGGYPEGHVRDPMGPAAGGARVLRGGSWEMSHPGAVSVTLRGQGVATSRAAYAGFRCARDAQ